MKNVLTTALAVALMATACTSNKEKNEIVADGTELFNSVKQFVGIGEHRTGTIGDSTTAAWLKSKLDSLGAKTEYVEFPLKQYFFENGKLTSGSQTIEIFPVWPVKEGLDLSKKATVVDSDKAKNVTEVKGKIALIRLKEVHGASTPEIAEKINKLISSGASGILAVTENNTGEIIALNTYDDQKPWEAPVYLLAPKDTTLILDAVSKKEAVNVEVNGKVKDAIGRDVVARIGTGKQFVVISTPISGWFKTGGERGPGIAIWLALAKWVSANPEKFKDYTFIFTGNSGHELSILGAKAFVAKAAPKPEDTKLWIHLGAAIAVKAWKEENRQWVLADSVDSQRGIYYDESVATAFESAFANAKGRKLKGTEENKEKVKPGGEGYLFKNAGYKNIVSIAHGHRLHHVKTDDETATSPELLADLEKTLETFISLQLGVK